MSQKEKPIVVYNIAGQYLSHCSKKRAAQLISREKAKWIGKNKLCLLLTQKEQKEIRKRVIERDNSMCYICETPLSENEITLDHVIPRNQGGTDYEDNLACCCQTCNADKADHTLEQYAYILYLRLLRYKYLGGIMNVKKEYERSYSRYAVRNC